MAFELTKTGHQNWAEAVREAAEEAGGDLILVLPAANEDGEIVDHAVVRLYEGGDEQLIAVAETEDGFALREEGEIPAGLIDFARASIDVLERLRGDEGFVQAGDRRAA